MRPKFVIEAFEWFLDSVYISEFAKGRRYETWKESDLDEIIRFFLLGWFGRVENQPRAYEKKRFDYLIGKTAIELAVAPRGGGRHWLTAQRNEPELIKLGQYNGLSLLILLDFHDEGVLTKSDFVAYRNAAKRLKIQYPINLAYVHWDEDEAVSAKYLLRS